MSKSVIIIGAGELGSRHLQGVLKSENKLSIFVIDLTEASLNKAKQRANEIPNSHEITFQNNYQDLPKVIDLAIIATNADVRLKVLQTLLEKVTPKHLLLEKVLFQDLKSYEIADNLLKEKSIKCYVNHPRRMSETYKWVQKQLISDVRRHYAYIGGNWGLACNGLHILDLLTFLEKSNISKIDYSRLDSKVYPSKRLGFIEITGTIFGTFENGNTFSITSKEGLLLAGTLTITDESQTLLIREVNGSKIEWLTIENNEIKNEETFSIPYPSELSKDVINTIINNESLSLPEYSEAKKLHQTFITGLLDWYNELEGTSVTKLPIT